VVATAVSGLLNLKLLFGFDYVSSTITYYTMFGVAFAVTAVAGLCMIEVLLSFLIFLLVWVAGGSSKNESVSLLFFEAGRLEILLAYGMVFLVLILGGDASS